MRLSGDSLCSVVSSPTRGRRVVRVAGALVVTVVVAPYILFFGGASLSFYLEDYCDRIQDGSGARAPHGARWEFPSTLACPLDDGSTVSFTSWFPLTWLVGVTALAFALVAAAWFYLVMRGGRPREGERLPAAEVGE